MTRYIAGCVAYCVAETDLYNVLALAREQIQDWKAPSRVSKHMDRGAVWNFFARRFDHDKPGHFKYVIPKCVKADMLTEFAEQAAEIAEKSRGTYSKSWRYYQCGGLMEEIKPPAEPYKSEEPGDLPVKFQPIEKNVPVKEFNFDTLFSGKKMGGRNKNDDDDDDDDLYKTL